MLVNDSSSLSTLESRSLFQRSIRKLAGWFTVGIQKGLFVFLSSCFSNDTIGSAPLSGMIAHAGCWTTSTITLSRGQCTWRHSFLTVEALTGQNTEFASIARRACTAPLSVTSFMVEPTVPLYQILSSSDRKQVSFRTPHLSRFPPFDYQSTSARDMLKNHRLQKSLQREVSTLMWRLALLLFATKHIWHPFFHGTAGTHSSCNYMKHSY